MANTDAQVTFEDHCPEVAAEITRRVNLILGKVAQDIVAEAARSMQGMHTGRVYQRGERQHVASAPGEPPAIDTGNLYNSLTARRVDDHTWWVGTNVEYGAILEFGSARMHGARPFLRPAMQKQIPAFLVALKATIEAIGG